MPRSRWNSKPYASPELALTRVLALALITAIAASHLACAAPPPTRPAAPLIALTARDAEPDAGAEAAAARAAPSALAILVERRALSGLGGYGRKLWRGLRAFLDRPITGLPELLGGLLLGWLDLGVNEASGLVVTADGAILTAAHVLDNAAVVRAIIGEAPVALEVLAVDEARDLALLRAPPGSGPWAPAVFRRRPPRLGEPVLLYGYPARALAARRAPTLTRGLVSSAALDIGQAAGRFQTDAASNPGSSGGPALDAAGAVIGIVAESGRPATAEDQSFVIPAAALEAAGYLRLAAR